MRDNQDDMIDRIVDELKTLPAVPADATARVLARVDAARRAGPSADADVDDVIYFPTATDEVPILPAVLGRPVLATSSSTAAGGLRRRFMVSLPAAIGYALAATLAGFLIRGALPARNSDGIAVVPGASVPGASVPGAEATERTAPGAGGIDVTPVASIASREAEEMPVQVQFVLEARRAKSVALVGDFNAWDGTANPLTRDSATGVWSTVAPVTPGRHVYAFLIDGSEWTLDPRAPKTKDADYGTEQSVLVVGVR